MKSKFIFLGLILILAIVMLGACNSGASGSGEEERVVVTEMTARGVQYYNPAEGDYRVQGTWANDIYFHPAINAYEVFGYLENVTDDTFKHVQLEAKYLDVNDDVLVTQTEEFYDFAARNQEKYYFRMEDSQYFKAARDVVLEVHILEE